MVAAPTKIFRGAPSVLLASMGNYGKIIPLIIGEAGNSGKGNRRVGLNIWKQCRTFYSAFLAALNQRGFGAKITLPKRINV
jgi:hypothetical protein